MENVLVQPQKFLSMKKFSTANEKLTFHCLPKERGDKRRCDRLGNHDDKDEDVVFFLK